MLHRPRGGPTVLIRRLRSDRLPPPRGPFRWGSSSSPGGVSPLLPSTAAPPTPPTPSSPRTVPPLCQQERKEEEETIGPSLPPHPHGHLALLPPPPLLGVRGPIGRLRPYPLFLPSTLVATDRPTARADRQGDRPPSLPPNVFVPTQVHPPHWPPAPTPPPKSARPTSPPPDPSPSTWDIRPSFSSPMDPNCQNGPREGEDPTTSIARGASKRRGGRKDDDDPSRNLDVLPPIAVRSSDGRRRRRQAQMDKKLGETGKEGGSRGHYQHFPLFLFATGGARDGRERSVLSSAAASFLSPLRGLQSNQHQTREKGLQRNFLQKVLLKQS